MRNKSILFYYHSRYCTFIDKSLVVPKFQFCLQKFRRDGFKIFYTPRQGTNLFPKNSYSIFPILHGISIKTDSKISAFLNAGRPLPGLFERFYWLIWIICIRPCLVIGFEPSQELCWICKVFKIPSVDIEHGIRDFHPFSGSYFYRNTYRYQNSILPDFFMTTFNEETLSSPFFHDFTFKPALINAGDLELAYYIENFFTDDLYSSPRKALYKNLSILILSQNTSRPDASAKTFPDFVVEFLSQISNHMNVKLTIRLHPKTSEDKEAKSISIKRYKQQLHFINTLVFEESTNSPLCASILNNHIIMTDDSSAYKTSLLLNKITIRWSSISRINQVDSSSRQFLFNLNISNIQEISSFIYERIYRNPVDTDGFNYSHILSRADEAYCFLKLL